MTECPFKKHCKQPKTESLKILGAESNSKLIQVCAKCPLLLSANKLKKTQTCCMHCNITFEEIITTQKVGCPYCYLFIKDLDKVVHAAQDKNIKHKGKKSKSLLLHFFEDIISSYIKNNTETEHDCEKLKKYLQELF